MNARSPYQAALWAPGGYGYFLRSSETGLPTEYFKFLLRMGRAVIYPVYKGAFERRIEGGGGPNASRELTIQYVKRDKRHVQLDSGRVPPLQDIVREVLDWFDRYLGLLDTNH